MTRPRLAVGPYGAALIDVLAVAVAYLLATEVRLGGRFDSPEHKGAAAVALAAGAVQVASNIAFRVYRRDWAAAALDDVIALGASSAAVAVCLLLLNVVSPDHFIPTTAVLPGLGLAVVAQAALKLRPRWQQILRAAFGRDGSARAAIVVGAGRTGQLVVRDLEAERFIRVACFVDDDERRHGTYVRGIPIAGGVADLRAVIVRHSARVVIVAVQDPSPVLMRRVLAECDGTNVRVRTARGFGRSAGQEGAELEAVVHRDPVDLAVGAGGVPFARPDIGEDEVDAVVEVLRSGWLTTGPISKRFEREFAARVGVPHALALNSGTAALHLALEAIGVGPGDEVILPTYTFTATAEVVRYLGARPVLVDVRRDDFNVDVASVERAIGPRTKAVIGVDVGGQPCDWHLLRELAAARSLLLVDDAAHALPAMLQGRPIGQWADLTAFSFYATKTLATGEGGMLVTSQKAWIERAETMSLHGIRKDAWKRYTAEGTWQYEVVAPGFKYNMTDVAAALGRVQLARLDAMQQRRDAIARRYGEAFAEHPALDAPTVRPDRTSSWHLYLLRLHLDALDCDRAAFIRHLTDLGIGTSVHFIPLHLHTYWREACGLRPEDLPCALAEYERVISLPIYSALTDAEADRVIEAVRSVADAHRR